MSRRSLRRRRRRRDSFIKNEKLDSPLYGIQTRYSGLFSGVNGAIDGIFETLIFE